MKNPPDISLATLEDLSSLAELEQLCFTSDKISRKEYARFISKTPALVFVMKQNNLLIGSALVVFRKHSRKARLYSIAIHPEFSRLGLGQTLHDEIQRHVFAKKCDEIVLEVRKENTAAIKFYEKNNYKVFGDYENFYEDGEAALRMRKVLDDQSVGISLNQSLLSTLKN